MKGKRVIGVIVVFLLVFIVLYITGDFSKELQPTPLEFSLVVDDVKSNSVGLKWEDISGANGYDVYFAPTIESLDIESKRKLVGSTDDTEYVVSDLAAGVDVFFRVVADGVDIYGTAHAKTVGGPRSELQTPLRNVHLFGPRVLMLVLENREVDYNGGNKDGDKGEAWQGGTWSITRKDGSSIGILNINRHTIPVSQSRWFLGYRNHNLEDDEIHDLDHRIYLELESEIGEEEILTIAHTGVGTDLGFVLPYSDWYLETPVIQLNQVGYNPRASRRYAYVSGWMGDGGGIDFSDFPNTAEVISEPIDPMQTRSISLSGLAIENRKDSDRDAGSAVKQIDLSSVPPAEGVVYRVRIPGVGVSWPTAVSEMAAFKAFYVVSRGLFLNRFGRDLKCEYTDWCERPPDHTRVYKAEFRGPDFFPRDTPRNEVIEPFFGGHHDAGDFDIRRSHTGIGQMLLRAYESNPDKFYDGQLDIPESGNGIPDLLDEALWNLKGWELLQENDGGVREGVESRRHPWGYYYADLEPENDPQADDGIGMPYWTYSRDTGVSARSAAIFAQAARLVRPFDQSRADELETRARSAWNYAKDNGASQAFLLTAAGELLLLTGELEFKTEFENIIDDYGVRIYSRSLRWPDYGFDDNNAPADFYAGYLKSPLADPELSQEIREKISDLADREFSKQENDWGHRSIHGTGEFDYAFGKSSTPLHTLSNVFTDLELETNEDSVQNYFDLLSLNADNILGGNPPGIVWITGLGSRSPQEPLHLDSLAFIKDRGMPPMPGIPAYGPIGINFRPQQSYYQSTLNMFYPGFEDQPAMYNYADIRSFVVSSEFTAGEQQAPLTLLFSLLLPENFEEAPECWKPGGNHHQNGLPALCLDNGICGNGEKEILESCDDGNLIDGDGCDSNCRVEFLANESEINETNVTFVNETEINVTNETELNVNFTDKINDGVVIIDEFTEEPNEESNFALILVVTLVGIVIVVFIVLIFLSLRARKD